MPVRLSDVCIMMQKHVKRTCAGIGPPESRLHPSRAPGLRMDEKWYFLARFIHESTYVLGGASSPVRRSGINMPGRFQDAPVRMNSHDKRACHGFGCFQSR